MINTNEEIIDLTETKTQIEARFKSEYPTLRTGNDEAGYTDLIKKDYDAKIAEWVKAHLDKIEQKNAEISNAQKKNNLLDRLGISLDEANLLLS